MNKTKKRTAPAALLLVALIPLIVAGGKEAGPLDRLNPEQKKQLEQGKPVFEHVEEEGPDGTTRGYGRSMILIRAPVDKCFEIFCEFDKQHLYFPRKTRSAVVKRWEDKALVEKELDFMVAKVKYTMIYTIDPERHRVDFELDPALPHENINDTAGYFHFEKVNDRLTLFTYGVTRLDTGVKVPATIQQYLTSRDLPHVAENVKKRIESGGKWEKPK